MYTKYYNFVIKYIKKIQERNFGEFQHISFRTEDAFAKSINFFSVGGRVTERDHTVVDHSSTREGVTRDWMFLSSH